MKISKQLYNRGNYWFKKFIDLYKHENLIVEPYAGYPYARVYYNNAKYKLLLADIELDLKQYNHYKNMQRDLLYSDKSFYEMAESSKGLDKAKSSINTIKGYWAHKIKLDRRLYLLKNNQEFLSTSLQNAKSVL